MTFLHAVDPDAYASELAGDFLGWAVFEAPDAFRPVHRIRFHPIDGPIILAGSSVYEVDPDTTTVYATDDAAMDAYYGT